MSPRARRPQQKPQQIPCARHSQGQQAHSEPPSPGDESTIFIYSLSFCLLSIPFFFSRRPGVVAVRGSDSGLDSQHKVVAPASRALAQAWPRRIGRPAFPSVGPRMRTHTKTVSDWSEPPRPATQRQPGPRLQTMRHAGRPTPAKLRCWRRATATGSSLVPQMRGWVDGRMQWPVSQHRSVIEPPAVVWRKDAASAGHGPLLLSCFAFRVASSFRRGCALSVCCGGALFASPLGEGGDPAVFRFPQRPPRRTESACPGRPFSAVRERPGICPPRPPVVAPSWYFGEDACHGHCNSSITNIERGNVYA